jgi:hypothetical protein
MAVVIPSFPMVNKGQLYISSGLTLSVTGPLPFAVTTTSLTISPGLARDSTDVNDITLTAPTVINARVNGANGLDQGVLAATTLYAVYVIGSSNYGNTPTSFNYIPTAGLISTSFTQPVLPTGYDMFRRIGTVLTNATAAPNAVFFSFTQEGTGANRRMWYDTPFAALAAAASAGVWTALPLATSVPTTAIEVGFRVTLIASTAGGSVSLRPTGSSSAVGGGGYTQMSSDVVTTPHIDNTTVPLIVSSPLIAPSIDWLTTNLTSVALATNNYIDAL